MRRPSLINQSARLKRRWILVAPLLRKGIPDIQQLDRLHLFELLKSRAFGRSYSCHRLDSTISHSSSPNPDCALECLPNEILDIILEDKTLNRRDLVALGLCSSRLWKHLLRICSQTLEVGILGDTPLFCTTTSLPGPPLRILELYPQTKTTKRTVGSMLSQLTCPLAPSKGWCLRTFSKGSDMLEEEEIASWIKLFHSIQNHGLNGRVLQELEASLRVAAREQKLCKGDKWFLRNIRTKEYVRAEVSSAAENDGNEIARDDGRGEGQNDEDVSAALSVTVVTAPWLHLERGLCDMVICRSNAWDSQMKEGIWTGHEFDIMEEETWLELDTAEWQDATEAFIKISARHKPKEAAEN